MWYYNYVYLIKSENRLVILEGQERDSDYHLFMSNNGNNYESLKNTCKMFCLGYIYGCVTGNVPVNNVKEFE